MEELRSERMCFRFLCEAVGKEGKELATIAAAEVRWLERTFPIAI
jgi:hypothetical protein